MRIFQLGVWVKKNKGQRLVSGQPHLESRVGPWNEVCKREVGNLTQIAKMAERTERAFPDCILLPVTAAIYHNGEEKPAMRWSFEMGIGGESDKELFDFVTRLREGFGISDRCSQLKILKYKIAISMKDFQVTANCPKGRLFEIDSQEQWNAAIAKVLTKELELIGRLPKSGLYLNIIKH